MKPNDNNTTDAINTAKPIPDGDFRVLDVSGTVFVVVGCSFALMVVGVVVVVVIVVIVTGVGYGDVSTTPSLSDTDISAHALNSSCGPQPTAPVPFSHTPQLLPATYFHCNTHWLHVSRSGNAYLISYTLFSVPG